MNKHKYRTIEILEGVIMSLTLNTQYFGDLSQYYKLLSLLPIHHH